MRVRWNNVLAALLVVWAIALGIRLAPVLPGLIDSMRSVPADPAERTYRLAILVALLATLVGVVGLLVSSRSTPNRRR